MKFSLLCWLALLALFLAACETFNMQISTTPTDLPSVSITPTSKVLQENTAVVQSTMYTPTPSTATIIPATQTITPTTEPTATSSVPQPTTPFPTWTPIPSFTSAPQVITPAPPAECPAGGTPISLKLEDLVAPNMQESIRAYLNARGSSIGLDAMLDSLTNQADPQSPLLSHVYGVDVTGDGVQEVVMDLTIPEVGTYATSAALVFACQEGQYKPILFLMLSPQEGMVPQGGYQVLAVEDMNVDGVRDLVVALKVFNNRRYYILAWDGNAFTSLIEPRFDDILLQTVYYIEAYNGEAVVMDTDGDGDLELVVTYNEDPIRRETFAWNGHAFVLQDK